MIEVKFADGQRRMTLAEKIIDLGNKGFHIEFKKHERNRVIDVRLFKMCARNMKTSAFSIDNTFAYESNLSLDEVMVKVLDILEEMFNNEHWQCR